jgi:hypothetical protein
MLISRATAAQSPHASTEEIGDIYRERFAQRQPEAVIADGTAGMVRRTKTVADDFGGTFELQIWRCELCPQYITREPCGRDCAEVRRQLDDNVTVTTNG